MIEYIKGLFLSAGEPATPSELHQSARNAYLERQIEIIPMMEEVHLKLKEAVGKERRQLKKDYKVLKEASTALTAQYPDEWDD